MSWRSWRAAGDVGLARGVNRLALRVGGLARRGRRSRTVTSVEGGARSGGRSRNELSARALSAGLGVLGILLVITVTGLAHGTRAAGSRASTGSSSPGGAPTPRSGAAGSSSPHSPPVPNAHVVGTVAFWIAVVLLLFALLALGRALWRVWQRRPRVGASRLTTLAGTRPEPAPDEAEVNEALVADGITVALRALEQAREPGDAIIRAWLGLEATAEGSGIRRRPAETPTEFTRRVLSLGSEDRAVRVLLGLYLRTRFGDRPPTAEDVQMAGDALRALRAAWPAPRVTSIAGAR